MTHAPGYAADLPFTPPDGLAVERGSAYDQAHSIQSKEQFKWHIPCTMRP